MLEYCFSFSYPSWFLLFILSSLFWITLYINILNSFLNYNRLFPTFDLFTYSSITKTVFGRKHKPVILVSVTVFEVCNLAYIFCECWAVNKISCSQQIQWSPEYEYVKWITYVSYLLPNPFYYVHRFDEKFSIYKSEDLKENMNMWSGEALHMLPRKVSLI